jgi:drug/metabolite transporter (DMT)-like permease
MTSALAVLANDALLLLAATIWGFAFVAQRAGMEHIGPITYNAVRFALGALALLPLVLVRRRASRRAAHQAAHRAAGRDPEAEAAAGVAATVAAQAPAGGPRRIHPLPAGLLAGAVLTGGAILQQAGIVSTTAGKAGFLTGLYVVLVPLAGLFWGQRAGWPRWLGMVLATCGLYLLSVTRQFTIERGDLLVLASTLFWTGHVLLLAWLSPRTDAMALAFVQNAVCAVLSGALMPFVEHPSLQAIRAAAVPILYGGLLSVGVGFTLQILGQRRAPPAHAALLLSMEAVFAALGGWWLLGERLGARGLAGCALMFAGMLCAQLPLLLRLRVGRTLGA